MNHRIWTLFPTILLMFSDYSTKFVNSNEIPKLNLTPNIQLTPIQSDSRDEYLSNTFAENLPSTSKLVSQPQIIINVKTLEQINDSLSIPKTKRHNSNTIINTPALDRIEQCQSPDMMTTPRSIDIIPTPDVVKIPSIVRIKIMVKNNKLFKYLLKKPLEIWGFIALLAYVLGLWFDTLR